MADPWIDDGYVRKNGVLVICVCRDRLLRFGEKCPGAFDDCPYRKAAPTPKEPKP